MKVPFLPMVLALLTFLRVAMLDPAGSSVLGAALAGAPELAGELVAICRRESHCRVIGAHPLDAWAGGLMRRRAMKVGWLDPDCPFHHGEATRFSTRGPYGMSAAYTVRFLGPCVPPEALDVPLLSAIAAARRAQYQCRRHGACTPEQRHRYWAGRGRVASKGRSAPANR